MRTALFMLLVLTASVAAAAQKQPIVIGETLTIHSKCLNEDRTVMVGLPWDYGRSTDNYPVVYVLDGRSHFLHTVSSSRFLAGLNKAPGMIVVAVTNTRRNRDMTTPDPENKKFAGNGGAEAFASFIGGELMPFINANYRTEKFNILIGHSLAGFFTVHTMLNHPDWFDAYIAISPSLYWNHDQAVNRLESIIDSGKSLRKFLYIAYGKEGSTGIIISVNKVIRTLESQASPGLRWTYTYMPREIHPSIPNRAVYDGLEKLFAGWMYDSTVKSANAEKMRRHYAALSEKLGFTCRPAENWMIIIGYETLRSGRIPEAVAYFKYYVELYPRSANAYDSLGEAYLKAGQKALAVANYKKSLELDPANQNAVKMLKRIREAGE